MTKSVFIVDDNCAMRQALSRLFNTAGGFQVRGQASSGAEAIQLIQDLRPDLIVLDLCMPGMNGLETAQELQHLELPSQVILYSMNADEIAAQHAKTAGIAALVSKAEGIKTLITKARIILDRSA